MAQTLSNDFHTFIAWADSCYTNNFQAKESMSEDLLNNPNGGAVAYVGTTRMGFSPGADCQREFFRWLRPGSHLGVLNDSRFHLSNTGSSEIWHKFTQNLLGDPEMPLWVGKPGAMKVMHPSETHAKENVLVTVRSPSGPIADAVVCFASGDSWVVTGDTDAAGQVLLNLDPPVLGNLNVVVTAENCVPHFGSVTVKAAYPDVRVTVLGLNNTRWGKRIKFRASVEGTTQQEVVWSLAVVTGAGTINQEGLYIAPRKDCWNAAIATSVANPHRSGRMAFVVTKEPL
jgi:hypothetical protein